MFVIRSLIDTSHTRGLAMTREEFLRDWEDYKLILKNGKVIILKDCFAMCFKMSDCDESLFFDTGGTQGADGYILKCDTDNNCFLKKKLSLPGNDPASWEECGKLVKT